MITILTGVQDSAAALTAERIRMDVVSQNIANAQISVGPGGRPYQRQQVVFQTLLDAQLSAGGVPTSGRTVPVARVSVDSRPPRMVYEPGNPNADSSGMVAYPDISIPQEMVDLITASRAFEANLAVIRNAGSLATQTLGIGRR
jgi:flagellar basal-body rod protein FlgC